MLPGYRKIQSSEEPEHFQHETYLTKSYEDTLHSVAELGEISYLCLVLSCLALTGSLIQFKSHGEESLSWGTDYIKLVQQHV